MSLKLKAREIPLVTFRRKLPEYLGPGGECFIEVDARAGGVVNIAYSAASEQLMLSARVKDRTTQKLTDDDAAFIAAQDAAVRSIYLDRFGVLYDTCVIDWRTNIVDADTGKPLACDRATFLALYEARVPEIGAAMVALEKAALEAGAAVLAEDEATLGN